MYLITKIISIFFKKLKFSKKYIFFSLKFLNYKKLVNFIIILFIKNKNIFDSS